MVVRGGRICRKLQHALDVTADGGQLRLTLFAGFDVAHRLRGKPYATSSSIDGLTCLAEKQWDGMDGRSCCCHQLAVRSRRRVASPAYRCGLLKKTTAGAKIVVGNICGVPADTTGAMAGRTLARGLSTGIISHGYGG